MLLKPVTDQDQILSIILKNVLIRLNLNQYCHKSKLISTYLTNTYISISKNVFGWKEMERKEGEGFGGMSDPCLTKWHEGI